MKTTGYFDNDVMARRPYLRMEWIAAVLANPRRSEAQPDGRTRVWGFVPEINHYLRVIVEPDGETVHNAFPDSGFNPED